MAEVATDRGMGALRRACPGIELYRSGGRMVPQFLTPQIPAIQQIGLAEDRRQHVHQ